MIIVVHVTRHQYFERSGNDLYCAVPISATQAILGADINVTSLDDKKLKLKIPAGTPHGKLLRLRNEGVPFSGTNKRGDLYIKVLVEVPTKLSSKQKDLLKEFMEIENPSDAPLPKALSELQN